jgi:hypothetical protein
MNRTKTAVRMACGLALVALVPGCAGNGEGLDENGRPIGETGGGGETPLTADFASIQANVFTPICTQCHSGAGAAQGLPLDAASSYAALVGVPSSEVPSLLRVKPGDPANSYLVHKIEGRASVGARMPLNQPALPSATIQVIRQWIQDGAQPAASAANAGTTLAVRAVSTSPTSVAVGLARAVDASLVNATTVQLSRVEVGANRPVDALLKVSPHNDALLLLVPRAPLAPGSYRLVLRGSGPVALADWNATALDGDADGQPGGDFTMTFQVGGEP